MQMVPGDPALLIAGEGASKETVEQIRHQLGLDKPFIMQYFSYIGNILQEISGFQFVLTAQC